MIISHAHKFIFIKSCKTAGTSIEVFLSAYCKPGDIITRIGEPTAEWHSSKSASGKFTQTGYYNHMSIGEVKQKCLQFDEYFKFTAVRHPLDRMLSLYHWNGAKGDFNQWIKYGVTLGKAAKLNSFYRIGGTIAIDDYIRYEYLEEDLQYMCEILGLEYDPKYLLHYKKRERKDVKITGATKDFIRRKFGQELIDFNYKI